jgi:hypothetical protein
MAESTEVEKYNYGDFVGSDDFLSFRKQLQAGSSAPDFEGTLLDTGKTVTLSDYWKRGDLLIEFGSLT